MFLPLILLIIGLVVLVGGGEYFIKGSASLARIFKVPAIVIGLTVVAFGTSVAELVVNVFSALQGVPDLAIGNILGSNISNIFLVLGIAAMIYPLSVKQGTVWREIPFGILAVLVLFLLANDVMFGNNGVNLLTRGDGLVLIAFFIIFLYYTYGLTKVEVAERSYVKKYELGKTLIFTIGGMLGLILGGKLIVDNATIIARALGMSDLFIGLTIVAIGTSLPELVSTGIAAYRRQDDLAIGNVVGSNIFNVLWVLGLTPVIRPIPFSMSANTDVIIATIAAIFLFAFMFIGHKRGVYKLDRWQGAVFVLLYVAYLVFVGIRG